MNKLQEELGEARAAKVEAEEEVNKLQEELGEARAARVGADEHEQECEEARQDDGSEPDSEGRVMQNDETRATEGGVLDGKEFSTPPMRNPSFFESEAASTSPRIMEPRLGVCACVRFMRRAALVVRTRARVEVLGPPCFLFFLADRTLRLAPVPCIDFVFFLAQIAISEVSHSNLIMSHARIL